MRKRRGEKPKYHGWLLVDKPAGMTSNDVLNVIKRTIDQRKMGHTGTLDPAATGLLLVALGVATKTIPYCTRTEKVYRGDIAFGRQTSTDDAAGESIAETTQLPQLNTLLESIPDFVGAIQQIPPKVSAVHVDGKRAYALAREGQDFELAARDTFVEQLVVESYCADDVWHNLDTPLAFSAEQQSPNCSHFPAVAISALRISITCNAGFYMRSLARDLAQAQGSLGYLQALRRTHVGGFRVEDGISLDKLAEYVHTNGQVSVHQLLRPLDAPLDGIPACVIDHEEVRWLRDGKEVFLSQDRTPVLASPDNLVRVSTLGSDPLATFMGLCRFESGRLTPERMLIR